MPGLPECTSSRRALQVERVPLDVPDDLFFHDLTLQALERALQARPREIELRQRNSPRFPNKVRLFAVTASRRPSRESGHPRSGALVRISEHKWPMRLKLLVHGLGQLEILLFVSVRKAEKLRRGLRHGTTETFQSKYLKLSPVSCLIANTCQMRTDRRCATCSTDVAPRATFWSTCEARIAAVASVVRLSTP